MCEKSFLDRTRVLVGEDGINKLKSSHIAVFGLGGVGGYAAEMLARSGIGKLSIIDNDIFDVTNINRQIFALNTTVGLNKCDVAYERLININSELKIESYSLFFNEENSNKIDFSDIDYCIDAIDSIASKIELIKLCRLKNIPIISSMGTGFRIDPTLLSVCDIYETKGCPMARIMRSLCKKNKIADLKVVYSEEKPLKIVEGNIDNDSKKCTIIGSMGFVPAAAGILLANTVIREILGL